MIARKLYNAWAMIAVELPDEAATNALADRISQLAQLGDIIALKGDLGAGKTAFARGFIRSRGNPEDVARLALFWQAARDVPEILNRARGEQHFRVRRALTALIRECLPEEDEQRDLHAEVIASALQAANIVPFSQFAM